MIYGIGTDIVQVSRITRWVRNPDMIARFFNPEELMERGTEGARSQHYAARFAAKEAFSKALGTGLSGFALREVFITNEESGKPCLNVQGAAADVLKVRCGKCRLHVSLSHERDYATAFVIIEGES